MGMHGLQSPPRNYPAPYRTKVMTTQRVHKYITYSSQTETGRDARHLTLLCLHTHLYGQTQTHKGGQKGVETYGEASYEKTGHTNFHNYLASQNSLYALYHPNPSTDSSLPQYVTVKMQACLIFQKLKG